MEEETHNYSLGILDESLLRGYDLYQQLIFFPTILLHV